MLVIFHIRHLTRNLLRKFGGQFFSPCATYNRLSEILTKVNDKKMGRSTRADEVVALALNLVTQEEVRALQEAALSNADSTKMPSVSQKYFINLPFLVKLQNTSLRNFVKYIPNCPGKKSLACATS
jgi:hypothetical protein